ncbi:MAG: Holliday junction resolvase RuvX [Candidatus Azobacteroides pseudotrichonymphae]|jgi:putative Holliday junction resolvase|uniref:Putative pre-16S rRNA nuclease n=1 Tax=Azobacteroides pseudotrichonymphae genomovar. CFP2 TaxID=511995 RepID=YQGF_AZOPC|nr:Holliday junction resolvase RuvX [Candidatus Azobacteroides pseudotrichonymphae]B6YQC7.1 RecName: Full=Putative pre-16S rRNA nuclease [Candidatus Azobacteroides pseudotrichonymphae genomovar. CFP2]MDR0530313.1 Holliday junction resolvase RuvX [Bacteroidales bacterium OttesenSCG-928-I14]BAG83399.1 putative Holliday junction resolvase [Candidatus Azobacteroides pseudotrichonymphae genomovar. CFP2]GMO35790.1 MAG: Holliday junction resolvase RuvX [Candidatus Azobacteroides pseudotrichonymphae]
MGRIVAIDYGEKRTGFAISDPLKMIVSSFVTVLSRKAVMYLKNCTENYDIELFVLGEPRQMDYTPSENMPRVEKFKRNLRRVIPSIDVQMVDERFTSVLAHRIMIEGGVKKIKRQDKGLVDRLSAAILLQTYLEFLRK